MFNVKHLLKVLMRTITNTEIYYYQYDDRLKL